MLGGGKNGRLSSRFRIQSIARIPAIRIELFLVRDRVGNKRSCSFLTVMKGVLDIPEPESLSA
jgi:hypothetical protein